MFLHTWKKVGGTVKRETTLQILGAGFWDTNDDMRVSTSISQGAITKGYSQETANESKASDHRKSLSLSQGHGVFMAPFRKDLKSRGRNERVL